MIYREIALEEINRELFAGFIRRQVVTDCYRKKEGKWHVESDPFIDDWSEGDYDFLVDCLRNTVQMKGVVYGAFQGGRLKGFASVEAGFLGSRNQYLDLTSIHVSQDMRGRGIGKALFFHAALWAKEQGAQKLYISAHSAVESQAFYRSVGCVEALEYNQEHVSREPYDCQLECSVQEAVEKLAECIGTEKEMQEGSTVGAEI